MSTVQYHIDYFLSVRGFTSNKNLNRLQKFQNRAARIVINNLNWDIKVVHIVKVNRWILLYVAFCTTMAISLQKEARVNIVKDLECLNIKQRRDYFVCLFFFNHPMTHCLIILLIRSFPLQGFRQECLNGGRGVSKSGGWSGGLPWEYKLEF